MVFRQSAPAPGRYGALLLLLITTYLLSAFITARWIESLQVVLFTAAGLIALRNSTVSRRTVRALMLVAVIGVPVFFATSISTATGDIGTGVANLWTGVILLAAAAMIVRRVLAFGTVTLQSIYGALSAYMIVGLMFAAFFAAIYHFSGDTFFASGEKATPQTFQYFSFTTLTTLGYGDYTAAESSGQAVAVLEALTGQVFLATLVARLVAAFRGPGDREN
ncbi:MAG: two pore domain potassium channel family protein [Actinobacteria bacterium]|nr:two pore domain potassium channel family protein [Actinomycetota bacterium]